MKSSTETTSHDDVVLAGLKARYFDAAAKENYPHTMKITRECDNLETAIRKLSPGQPLSDPMT